MRSSIQTISCNQKKKDYCLVIKNVFYHVLLHTQMCKVNIRQIETLKNEEAGILSVFFQYFRRIHIKICQNFDIYIYIYIYIKLGIALTLKYLSSQYFFLIIIFYTKIHEVPVFFLLLCI